MSMLCFDQFTFVEYCVCVRGALLMVHLSSILMALECNLCWVHSILSFNLFMSEICRASWAKWTWCEWSVLNTKAPRSTDDWHSNGDRRLLKYIENIEKGNKNYCVCVYSTSLWIIFLMHSSSSSSPSPRRRGLHQAGKQSDTLVKSMFPLNFTQLWDRLFQRIFGFGRVSIHTLTQDLIVVT